MFSNTLRSSIRLKLWKTKPMRPLRMSVLSFSLKVVTSLLLSMNVPSVGLSSNPRIFSNVDFPQPDGPIIATNSPCFTSKLTSRSAQVSISSEQKTFLMFDNCIISLLFFPILILFFFYNMCGVNPCYLIYFLPDSRGGNQSYCKYTYDISCEWQQHCT